MLRLIRYDVFMSLSQFQWRSLIFRLFVVAAISASLGYKAHLIEMRNHEGTHITRATPDHIHSTHLDLKDRTRR